MNKLTIKRDLFQLSETRWHEISGDLLSEKKLLRATMNSIERFLYFKIMSELCHYLFFVIPLQSTRGMFYIKKQLEGPLSNN